MGNRLEDLAEAAQDTEWLELKRRGVEYLPARIGDRYLAQLPADRQPYELSGDRWPDRNARRRRC